MFNKFMVLWRGSRHESALVNQFERQERQNVRFSPQYSLVRPQVSACAQVQIMR